MDIKIERKRKEGLRDCLFGEENAEIQTNGEIGKHFKLIFTSLYPSQLCLVKSIQFTFSFARNRCLFLFKLPVWNCFFFCVWFFFSWSAFGVNSLRCCVALTQTRFFSVFKKLVCPIFPLITKISSLVWVFCLLGLVWFVCFIFLRLGKLWGKGSSYTAHLHRWTLTGQPSL